VFLLGTFIIITLPCSISLSSKCVSAANAVYKCIDILMGNYATSRKVEGSFPDAVDFFD
jgi:hypothetical protein